MEYAQLEKSGLNVSRICLGTWHSLEWLNANEKQFYATIREALELGINFFDSAEIYANGMSESWLGKALQGKRDKVILATKFAHTNSSPTLIRKSLEASLRRLRTDFVDLYQQHWPPKTPPLTESLVELVKLKAEGKIRAIGVSNWMEPEFDEYTNLDVIDSLQPCYNLMWRGIERFILPLCVKNNISILAYSPLCQGLLAGKFLKASDVPDDFRQKNVLLKGDYFALGQRVLSELVEIGSRENKSPGSVALRWLLDTRGVCSVIVGASSPEQLKESVTACKWKLADSDYKNLAALTGDLVSAFPPHSSMWGWHSRA